ncbi:MAG: PAS domain S-box protein [Chitinivibrionales bacterium]|nr:PAS domain S-box protein [Chitinivibrionales bacterium]
MNDRGAGSEQLVTELEKLRQENNELKRLCEDREAFEYTGTAMMVIEQDMTISMGNREMLAITGYSKEELREPKRWTDYVLEEDRQRMIEYHQRRRENPDTAPSSYEFRLRDPQGRIRDVLAYVNMVPQTGKSIVSLTDITERKAVERELRASEERYRELYENANDIIYVHDFEGAFLSVNAAALRTYGYTRDEIDSLGIHDIIDPDYLPLALRKVREKLTTAEPSEPYELLTHTSDKRPVWVEVNTRPIVRDGKPVAIQGIARDITERKLAEMRLGESQQRFRETTELLPAIVCELDTDRKITYVNRLGSESFGYTAEDIADGVYIDDLVHQDDFPLMLERFKEIVAGTLRGAQEYRMVHKDGTVNEYLLNSSPIIRDGRIMGLRTCLLDVQERNEALRRLGASEERFRRMFSQSPIGIALFGTDEQCQEGNLSFLNMFSISPDELPSLGALLDLSDEQRKRLAAGDGITLEKTAPGDKGERHYSWYVSPLGVSERGQHSLLVQVQDVTEQRRAERARLNEAQEAAEQARRMVADLRKDMVQTFTFNDMVSRSPRMREVFDILPQIADTPATVLVCGESGTGKELIARAVHELSPRRDKPFVAINCSALPDNLLESELFGYKAGAFTDAKKDKPGKFALAEGGTIFLDEIGDISPAMQVKLLRVLQERMYEPLGATSSVSADVRIVTATNRDLPSMVKEGRFREDLFYRIKVLQITLPPLRERLCDIPLLANHFIGRFNSRYGKAVRGVSQDALELLLAHAYPGNIRELENVIEHAFVFCTGDTIGASHLPPELRESSDDNQPLSLASVENFDELEKLYIESVLEETGGNKLRAAEKLGIHKATLFRKLRKLGIGATE